LAADLNKIVWTEYSWSLFREVWIVEL